MLTLLLSSCPAWSDKKRYTPLGLLRQGTWHRGVLLCLNSECLALLQERPVSLALTKNEGDRFQDHLLGRQGSNSAQTIQAKKRRPQQMGKGELSTQKSNQDVRKERGTHRDRFSLVEELLGKFHRLVGGLLGGELHKDRCCRRDIAHRMYIATGTRARRDTGVRIIQSGTDETNKVDSTQVHVREDIKNSINSVNKDSSNSESLTITHSVLCLRWPCRS